jgi:pyruvate/2-oxoglutarate dehydrogenase complex dihydrolipoamide dehydrogenase (E3) component
MFAIGRYAVTKEINLQNAGVISESNGKFRVNEQE